MLVWAVASQKGGVGKTTSVATLAGWLVRQGLRVLVVDTDPHASLTAYLGFSDEKLERSLYDLYKLPHFDEDSVSSAVTYTRFAGLDLIASTMALATVDRQLSGRQGVGRILSRILNLMHDDYDVVLIDCPPVLGALMVNALVAASLVIVPTQAEFLALKGLEGMVKTFDIMQKAMGGKEINYLIVPTMYDDHVEGAEESVAELHERYEDHLWDDLIPLDNGFRDSSFRHIPLPLMNRRSRGNAAYLRLLKSAVAFEIEHNGAGVPDPLKKLLEDEQQQKSERSSQRFIEDDVSSMLLL